MNIRKNIEAVFVAAAMLGVFASYATAKPPVVQLAKAAPARAVAADAKMQVVVITGRRLSAAEKAALI
jgi:hypothetical protein